MSIGTGDRTPRQLPLGRREPSWLRRLLVLGGAPFAIPVVDAQTHMHVIGVSGSGKSRFLAGLYLNLLARGRPATLIDPHGDLARLVLAHLVARGLYKHPDAFRRVLYLDLPAAEACGKYLPFNVL